MHDPFSMRPFFGYNFGDYLAHWLSFGRKPALQLPRIFMVNWFRRTPEGGFMWPGTILNLVFGSLASKLLRKSRNSPYRFERE